MMYPTKFLMDFADALTDIAVNEAREAKELRSRRGNEPEVVETINRKIAGGNICLDIASAIRIALGK